MKGPIIPFIFNYHLHEDILHYEYVIGLTDL